MTSPTEPLHDPHLDPMPSRHAANGQVGSPWSPQEYQRLVANPFLALLGLVFWFAALRQALATRNLILVGLVLLGLIAVAYLLQYHCLDCGATGLLFRWKRHACERVRSRQTGNQVRRFRGPNPTTQVLLWVYLLGGLAILISVAFRAMSGP
jgi:hypothetical protein